MFFNSLLAMKAGTVSSEPSKLIWRREYVFTTFALAVGSTLDVKGVPFNLALSIVRVSVKSADH